MAPAQSLAGDDEEQRKPTMIACSEEKKKGPGLVCESNFEDSEYHGDSLAGEDKPEGKADDALDEEVDVEGYVEGEALEIGSTEDPDATEHSSSFGNTCSGSDDEVRMSDVEVDSQFSLENGEQPASDGFTRLFKKKRVTDHWRKFISPLTWRCQWLELRMNEIRTQALLYDKELAAYKHEKQLQSKMIELGGSVSKSVPLTCQRHRRAAMKRRKRRRNEDTVDISSYMSNHTIFSYYDNKKSETDGHSVDDACEDQVDDITKGNDDPEWFLLGVRRGDSSLEQILYNIECLQSRVLHMKAKLGKATSKSLKDITSSIGNFIQGDPPASYVRSHSLSPGNNGGTVTHHGDGSTVSSYGEAADVDMLESTVGLLDAPLHQHMKDLFSDDIVEDVLINNEAADEDLKNFEQVSYGREKLLEIPKEEIQSCSEDENNIAHNNSTTTHTPTAVVPSAAGATAQQSVLKPCYTGKKRGRKPKKRRGGGSVAGLRSDRLQRRRLN